MIIHYKYQATPRAQPYEGSSKRQRSSLYGRFGATNSIPVHSRGAKLPYSNKVQNVADRNVRRNERPHLNTYKNQMEMQGYQDPIRCRAFTITLKGPTLAWFNILSPSSISSFTELSIAFVSHFIGARTHRKPSYHLLTIKQNSQESIRSYVQRFNAE